MFFTTRDYAEESSLSLADSVRSFKKMLIGVGLTELPDGCVPGGLYGVFNAQQMKLVTDYMFIRSLAIIAAVQRNLFHNCTEFQYNTPSYGC